MDKKDIMKQIKALFTIEEEVQETPINFVDVKTDDGRILRVSDIALEGKVMEITEAGEVEVEDGTYTLDSGIGLVVEGGMIKEIVEAPEEEIAEEVPAQAPVQAQMEEEVAIDEEKEVAGVVNHLKDLISQVKDLKSKFEALAEENKTLKEQVDKFAKTPSAEPTKTKIDFKKENTNTKDSYLHSMLKNKK